MRLKDGMEEKLDSVTVRPAVCRKKNKNERTHTHTRYSPLGWCYHQHHHGHHHHHPLSRKIEPENADQRPLCFVPFALYAPSCREDVPEGTLPVGGSIVIVVVVVLILRLLQDAYTRLAN